jgi:hypothetical protein
MVTLNRTDFLIQCAKAKKSFNDTLPCIIDMEDDLWTVDETHGSYPHINFSASNPNEQIILCGSMAGIDKIQQEFMSKKQGN